MNDGKSSICTDDCVVTITQVRPGAYTIEHRYKTAMPEEMRDAGWAHAVQWWYVEWMPFYAGTDEELAKGLLLAEASTFAARHHKRQITGSFPDKMVHSGMMSHAEDA